jgi:alkylation response protein AidB-like acyl-CoA dehydrogenase
MNSELNNQSHYFLQDYLPAQADELDRNEETPVEVLQMMGRAGLLSYMGLPEYGGLFDNDLLPLGELCEAVAVHSPAVQSQITVHSMVCYALQRWGSKLLKEKYLSGLASGKI